MKFGIERLDDNEEVNRVVHKELDLAFEQIRTFGPESRERCVMACLDRLAPFFKKMGVDVRSSKKGLKFMTAALRIELQKRIDADVKEGLAPGPASLSRYDRPGTHEELSEVASARVRDRIFASSVIRPAPLNRSETENRIKDTQRRIQEIVEDLDSKNAQQRVLIEVLLKEFDLGFDFQQLCTWARDLARGWQAPPKPDTPGNFETIAMNVMHFTCAVGDKLPYNLEIMGHKLDVEEYGVIEKIWEAVARQVPEFERVMRRCREFYTLPVIDDFEATIGNFAGAWRDSSYAKLEIGHKLAAALCVTDIKDEEVMAPWKACSIIVPDGLFRTDVDLFDKQIARIWCIGIEPILLITQDAKMKLWLSDEEVERAVVKNRFRENDAEGVEISLRLRQAIRNFVRGAFLALANPDDFKKSKASSTTSSKPKREHSAPDLSQVRYLLSAPIQVDLREALREHLSGRRKGGGGTPKVQFLVRGHWRQQAHGKGHLLRKTIWIKPFLKGDPAMRMLLRNYAIKDSESGKPTES